MRGAVQCGAVQRERRKSRDHRSCALRLVDKVLHAFNQRVVVGVVVRDPVLEQFVVLSRCLRLCLSIQSERALVVIFEHARKYQN